MEEVLTLVVATLAATLRVATPLVLCAMGGLFSEKSGIIDVGLEGKMLMAAFFAAATASLTGSAWAGVGAAVLAAEVLALLHGFACITHRGNQVVSGVAINILAMGLTVVLGTAWFSRGGFTHIRSQARARLRFQRKRLPARPDSTPDMQTPMLRSRYRMR